MSADKLLLGINITETLVINVKPYSLIYVFFHGTLPFIQVWIICRAYPRSTLVSLSTRWKNSYPQRPL